MYHFTEESEGFYTFTNNQGIEYVVLFSRDDYIFPNFPEKGLVFEVMVEPKNHENPPHDSGNGVTICSIISDFINRSEGRVILYICQNNDRKARLRNKLFDKWFDQYAEDPQIEKISLYPKDKYTAVLLKNTNPSYNLFMSAINYYLDNPDVLEEWLNSKDTF